MTQGFYEQLGVDPGASTSEIRSAYGRVVAQLSRRRKAVLDQGGDPSPLELSRAQADEAWQVLADPARRRRYDAMRALQNDGWTEDPNELWRKVAGALVHPAAGAAADLLRVVTTLKVGALPPDPGAAARAARPAPTPVAGDTQKGAPRRAASPGGPKIVPKGGRSAEDEVTVTATSPTLVTPRTVEVDLDDDDLDDFDDVEVSEPRMEDSSDPRVVALPRPQVAPEPSLRVVDGTTAAPVVVMPAPSARTAAKAPPTGTAPVKPVPAPPAPRKKPVSSEDVARLVDQHGYTGALLRSVREAKGMTLQEVSDTTRISVRYLEAIEAGQHDRLPSATFVRGYVREMARVLALDEEATVAGYMRNLQ